MTRRCLALWAAAAMLTVTGCLGLLAGSDDISALQQQLQACAANLSDARSA